MQQYFPTLPLLLSVCLAASAAVAAELTSAVDGTYSGEMTLGPGGLNHAYTAPACENNRPVEALIRSGFLDITYRDWHRHPIHYNGRVTADGVVSAYQNVTATAALRS